MVQIYFFEASIKTHTLGMFIMLRFGARVPGQSASTEKNRQQLPVLLKLDHFRVHFNLLSIYPVILRRGSLAPHLVGNYIIAPWLHQYHRVAIVLWICQQSASKLDDTSNSRMVTPIVSYATSYLYLPNHISTAISYHTPYHIIS